MPTDDRPATHPDSLELSAYLDGALVDADRARVEAHLAVCTECRDDVAAVSRLLRTAPARRMKAPYLLAAAATLALMLVPALDRSRPAPEETLREPAVTTTAAPIGIAPAGSVETARELVWTAVPRATRYRLTLLDSAGTAIWRWETGDTLAVLPDSVRLRAGASYFWKVDAETGFDRWVASDLIDFTVTRSPP